MTRVVGMMGSRNGGFQMRFQPNSNAIFDLREIFFRVHTDRIVRRFFHGDANAVLEEA